VALAWLLARQPWIVPIPRTRRVQRIEDNIAAAQVPLSADEVADIDALATTVGVAGNRYNDAGLAMVGL
jgi:aryl-alcohol dehydrogenase-like predicted oxidoreductase